MPSFPASYCTVSLMYVLNPRIGSITTIDSEHISIGIGMAEAEMNGKLAKRYDLPFSVDIPFLSAISANLASYYILRRQVTKEKSNKSDWVDSFKVMADEMLKQIVENQVELLTASNAVVARTVGQEAWSNTMDYQPTMFEGDPSEWVVDPDKIQDERDARD